VSDAFLAGGRVQRVDVGARVTVLHVRLPGETWFVVCAPGPRGGIGVARARPWRGAAMPGGRGAEADAQRLRTALLAGAVVSIGPRSVLLEREGATVTLDAPVGAETSLALRHGAGPWEDAARGSSEEQLLERGAELAEAIGEGALDARRQALARALRSAVARVARRVAAIEGDLGRIDEASAVASRGSLFVVEAGRAPRGATKLVAMDWSEGEARQVELPLDPARTAREQLDALFRRGKRLKEGRVVAAGRLADAVATAARLSPLGQAALAAESDAVLDDLARAARAAAPRDFALATQGPTERRARAQPPRPPYREFRVEEGARVLVGRGAEHNDALTVRVARPQDLWLHAKGHTGAHVVVPLERNESCPAEVLVDAAHLAAHFSDARGEPLVEVQYTPRRYVRKPRRAPPGLVVVEREKVIVLRVDPLRLARLLASEELGSR
jgi:hypothetical protein